MPISPRPGELLCHGIRGDGSPATCSTTKSILTVGSTGSGKSNDIRARIFDLVRQQIPVELYISDLKQGMELGMLGSQKGKGTEFFKVVEYATTVAETNAMLHTLEFKRQGRAKWLAERGQSMNEITTENPLRIAILDECLFLEDQFKKGINGDLGKRAFAGRATSDVMWLIAQLAQKDVLGPVRDLIPERVGFRLPSPVMTDMLLGQGTEAAGAKCSKISPETPGIGYSFDRDTWRAVAFRAPRVTDKEFSYIAKGQIPPGANTLPPILKGQTRTALYRLFSIGGEDENGEYIEPGALLYVGITHRWPRRMDEHAEEQPWAHLVDWDAAKAQQLEWFSTRAEAEYMEGVRIAEALAAGAPLKNIAKAGTTAMVRARRRLARNR
jgi:predicted GIY-YIG superfamily endonuclease